MDIEKVIEILEHLDTTEDYSSKPLYEMREAIGTAIAVLKSTLQESDRNKDLLNVN